MRIQRFFSSARFISLGRVVWYALALLKVPALPESPGVLYVVFGVFLAFAAAVAVQNRLQTGAFRLLALLADTVLFLILASFVSSLPWLPTLLFIHLLAEALLFFGPFEVFLVVITSLIFCIVLPHGQGAELLRTVLTGGPITCACSIAKRKQVSTITTLRAQLYETQKAKEKAVENERQRIASDFHDGPLQSFISLQMRLEILRKLLERDLASGLEDLRELQSLAVSQIRDLRAFLHSMRPADVDGANLMASARRTAESFQKESGIPVTFLGENTPVGLPQEATSEVLQMLREALHNVQKHAGATRVAVAVEKGDRVLEISVDDNGHGFSFAGSYSLEELELLRLGPASLKRRARSLNADLQLESRPGRGAGLKFRIPLQ